MSNIAIPPPPAPFYALPAGTRLIAGLGHATVLPDMDFETYSEAGYVWNAEKNAWAAPRGSKDRGLFAVGAARYSEHPTTEVLSFFYDLKDGAGARHWRPGMQNPVDLFAYLAAGGLVESWNSGFEWYIWNNVCTWRYGWPALALESLRCAMAKGRAFSLPGALEKAGEVLRIAHEKDKEGRRLLEKFSMPRNPTKADARLRITLVEDPVDAEKLVEYNRRDILAEAEASSLIPDLEGEELECWLMDQRINRRGVQIDTAAVADCVAILDQALDQYNTELHALTAGSVERASQLERLKGWLGAQGVTSIDKMDEDALDTLLKRTDLSPLARRAIEIRSLVGSASVKKLFAMSNQVTAAGRLHDLFTYHGARTGRTTGNGPQPTNLPKAGPDLYECFAMRPGHKWSEFEALGWTKAQAVQHGYADGCLHYHGAHTIVCPWCARVHGPAAEKLEWTAAAADDALQIMAVRVLSMIEHFFGDALLTISGVLRGLFIAAPGHDIICSDYSAIEAVVLAMLAGVKWREEVFRTHGKIYEASGATVAKLSIDEVVGYKKIHGKHHPIRAKGKVMELACGYGGWIGAMRAFGADAYMTEEEMKQAVLDWRAASPEIPEFWGGQWRRTPRGWRPELFGCEGMFVAAVLQPGQVFEFRGLKFQMRGDALYVTLLSGRRLVYHAPRLVKEDKFGREQYAISYMGWNTNPKNGPKGWVRMDTYGGRLTENFVQATARDIQWHGMLNLERAGYPIVLHVYDENAGEVPHGFGSVEEFERIMSSMPSWCADWPVRAAGGWRGRRYRKD